MKSQEILFTEENNQNKTVPKLKPSDLTEDISIFDHSLNFTKKENDFNTRLNQSYRVEDKSFLNKSKGMINSKIVKRYHNEKDGIENEIHKHHNWLSNLKTQVYKFLCVFILNFFFLFSFLQIIISNLMMI